MALHLLILLPRIPYPLRDGGAIAMNQTLEELVRRGCQVTVLAMNTARHFVEESDLPPLYQQLKRFETVFIDNTINPLSAFLNLFTGKSYNIERFVDKNFKQKLSELLQAETFDVVWFESIYTSMYLEDIQEQSQAKCFCRVHNIEHRIWQRLSEHESSFFKRKYLELLTERLRNYELHILHEFDLLLPISKTEEHYFEKEKINASYYLPFGTRIQPYPSVELTPGTCYHIGSMDWAPNLEGVEWFMKDVWKELRVELPDLTLYLAGKKMPKQLFDLQNKQTLVVGEVEDVNSFCADKQLMLVPLLSGAGIRVKILEAMSMGKAIIATPMAVEGIGVQDGVHILLAETAQDFKDQIKKYYRDVEACLAIGARAREFVRVNYEVEKIYVELVEGIQHLL
jgi:glycosyltransferase involved in cell wall biosynthesis